MEPKIGDRVRIINAITAKFLIGKMATVIDIDCEAKHISTGQTIIGAWLSVDGIGSYIIGNTRLIFPAEMLLVRKRAKQK